MATSTQAAKLPIAPRNSLYEVVLGQRVEKPMSMREIRMANLLSRFIAVALGPNPPGEPFVEVLFRLNPGPILDRRPDVSYVPYERWPDRQVPETEAWEVVPALAVEIVSKNNKANEIQAKIEEYFSAGVSQVWIIYPRQRKVMIYEALKSVRILDENDTLECESILPVFRLSLKEFFALQGGQ